MPLLQVRNFPPDIYEAIKTEAKNQQRTITQQTIVLIKNGLKKEKSQRERRLQAIERTVNMVIPDEEKNYDVVKSIREDRNR